MRKAHKQKGFSYAYLIKKKKGPDKFALKTGIEYLNEIRLLEGEAQDSTMSWFDWSLTVTVCTNGH